MPVTGHAETPAIRSLLRRPNLTAGRERQLLSVCRSGCDDAARQQALAELWESHSKLIVAVARQFHRPDLDLTDLVGAGNLGMHAAIEAFDPERSDGRLSVYAVGWIRHYIQDYIRRRANPVPPSASPAHRQLFRTTGRLFADARRACHRDGVAVTESELCARVGARVGLSGDEVARCLSLARGDVNRNGGAGANPLSSDGRYGNEHASPEEAKTRQLHDARHRRQIVSLADEILGERERKVFFARCIVGADNATHPENLAADLGVTRERVHLLEASARRKIEVALANGVLRDPADGRPRLRGSRRIQRSLIETPG